MPPQEIVNRRRSTDCLIVSYHYVRDTRESRFNRLNALSPVGFALQVGNLANICQILDTKTRISKDATESPEHLVVRLIDDELFQCPFVQMSDVGTLGFTEAEVVALRAYLLKGGFL